MAKESSKFPEPVYGSITEGDTPTLRVGDPVPDTLNATGDGPEKPSDKPVKFKSPWGTVFTVSSDDVEKFKEMGYKPTK